MAVVINELLQMNLDDEKTYEHMKEFPGWNSIRDGFWHNWFQHTLLPRIEEQAGMIESSRRNKGYNGYNSTSVYRDSAKKELAIRMRQLLWDYQQKLNADLE